MYEITIEQNNKVLKVEKFVKFSDVTIAKRKLIKEHNLTKQRGFYGNAKTGIELTTNF